MNEELIEYYANLLILQYRTKSNAQRTISAFIRALMIYDLIRDVENGYNVDTAVGLQLDVIAKYVGAERVASGIVIFDRTFFSYIDYNEPGPHTGIVGYIRYDETNTPDAQYLRYRTDQQSIYTLTDSELRIIIKLKILQNNSNHSVGEIDNLLNTFFPDQVIFTDNFNMAISYLFDRGIERIIRIAESQGAIPKPAAVGISIDFVDDINNIFSLLKYSSGTPADFSQGYRRYSQDPFGSYLRY